MPLLSMARRAFVLSLVVALLPVVAFSQDDPILTFVNNAASVWSDGGDEPLSGYIAEHPILVGAAVAQLLDVAIEVGDAGNTKDEKENVEFAELVARLYKEKTGSAAPLDLVTAYQGWGSSERSRRAKAKNLEAQSNEARADGDLPKAEQLLLDAKSIYEAIGDRHSRAVVFGSLGVVYWYAGDFDGVIEHYESALQARREVEDRILEGKTLNGLGSAYRQKGDSKAAIDFYGQAVALRRETKDLGGLGTSLTYLGDLYQQVGRVLDARKCFEEALPILEASGKAALMVDILTAVANLNSDMKRQSAANESYRKAIEIAAATDQPLKEAASRINLGTNLRLEGSYNESLAELDAAEELLDRAPDTFLTASLYRERGLTHLAIGELDRAREDLLSCARLAQTFDNPVHHIEALINIGLLYQKLGAYDRGLKSAAKAKKLAGESELPRLVREADVLAAELEWLRGRPGESLAGWRRALERDRADGLKSLVVQDELGMANANALLGKNDEARKGFWSAYSTVSQLGSGGLESAVHLGIAHTYEKENPDSAVFHYERALAAIEKSRATLGSAAVRSGFLSGERRFFYEEVARYYASLDRDDKSGGWSGRAFETAERAKARGLLDLLEQSVLGQASEAENALLDSLYHMGDSGEAEKKEQLKKRYAALRDERLRNSIGDLAAGRVATIAEVQGALPKGTVLLEYALGDTSSLMWAVDGKGHSLYVLPDRKTIRVQVERLRDAIARPGAGDATLLKTARNLYSLLVAPAEDRLARNKNLIIIPDGILFETPFEVLLTGEPGGNPNWEKQPFLARRFDTIYAPSASVFLKLENAERKGTYSGELLALGDPDFSRLRAAAGSSTALAPLPHTRSEVLNISSRLKDDQKQVLLGDDASESLLKENLRARRPRVLHLATHGLINPLQPVSSSVALSRSDGSTEDGYLHTLEILSLPLDVGLVVLSACETARGKVGRGEGVVGLSRAFIASGAGGVVASLWAVSDESTSQLMSEFYKKMFGKKHPAGRALNEARLAMIKKGDFAHPFYWSPFIVIGTDRSPW